MEKALLLTSLALFTGFAYAKPKPKPNPVVPINAQIVQLISGSEQAPSISPQALGQIQELAKQRHDLIVSSLHEYDGNETEFFHEATLPKKVINFILKQNPNLKSLFEEPAPEFQGTFNIYSMTTPNGVRKVYDIVNSTTRKNVFITEQNYNPRLKTGAVVRIQEASVVHETNGVDDLILSPFHIENRSHNPTIVADAPVVASDLQNTLFIHFNFSDNTAQPYSIQDSQAAILTAADSVNSYYVENSAGRISISGDFVGWLTIPNAEKGACDPTGWGQAADAAAKQAGFDPARYAHIVYLFAGFAAGGTNYFDSCTFGGLGTIGGAPTRAWINLGPSSAASQNYVIGHELGHNLGIHHANKLDCGDKPIDIAANCTSVEYGDPFDVMGGMFRLYNSAHKIALNWTNPGQIQTVSSNGDFRVVPLENFDQQSLKVLKIHKPDTNEDYYVSYRLPQGHFDTDFMFGGLPASNIGTSIHVWNGNPVVQTKVIEVQPNKAFMLDDNQLFSDPINSVFIKQDSHDNAGLNVTVSFGSPPCIQTAPSVSVTPADQAVDPGEIANYTVIVTDNDTPACGPAVFNLSSALPAHLIGSFSQSALSLSPGQTGTLVLSAYADFKAPNGSYQMTIHAAGGGGAGDVGARLTVLNTDHTAPTGRILSPANGAILHGPNMTVTTLVQDNNRVYSVSVLQDGKVVGKSTAPPFTVNYVVKKFGLHKLRLKIVDYSGNVGHSKVIQVHNRKF